LVTACSCNPRSANKRRSTWTAGFGVVNSTSPRNTEFAPAHETERLRFERERRASRAQAHERLRHDEAGRGDRPHELQRIFVGSIAERRTFDAGQQVNRHAFRMRPERRQLVQHPAARPPRFAHADDAAAAHGDAGLADARDGLEPFGVRARRDDAAIELGRRVEIMVVRRKAGVGERIGLRLRQHAERAARFHAERPDAANHREHAIEFLAFGRVPPRRPHAEPGGALLARPPRRSQRLVHLHQIVSIGCRCGSGPIVGSYAQSSGQPPLLTFSSTQPCTSFG